MLIQSNSVRVVVIAFLVWAFVATAFGKDKKKNAAAAPAAAKKADRIGVDISKLFWPQAPAIARLKYLDLYTGQKIDWAEVKKLQEQTGKKQKLSWKDKLAGSDPNKTPADDFKMPFQLMAPTGIAFDSKGRIYLADSKVGGIFIYNPEDKSTSFLVGGKDAHFGQIAGMVMDDTDRLFVADSKLRRLTVLDNKGHEEETFGADVMVSPAGVALDRENRLLYVVDTQLDQVLVYDADSYNLLRRMGTSGKKHTLTDPGNFSLPTHCAVDGDGNLFVTDTLNNRVEVFDADGNFIRQFGKAGDAPGRFGRPRGIAVDADGHVWVADGLLQRVQVFDQEGRLLMWVGQEGELPGMFSALNDIAIDVHNRVVTTEDFPARAQIFRYVTDEEAAAEKERRAKERLDRAASTKGSTSSTPEPQSKPATSNTTRESAADGQPVAQTEVSAVASERKAADHSKYLGFGDHRQSETGSVSKQ